MYTEKQLRMIAKARKKYGKISPCGGKKSFHGCFSVDHLGRYILWFNDAENNTDIVFDD